MPSAAAGLVALCAALVLVGWQLDIEVLKGLLRRAPTPMNPVTALCFLLLAAAIVLDARGGLIALAVAVVGALRLTEYAFGWHVGVDRLLFRSRLHGNVIAPNTAVALVMTGAALVLLDVRTRRRGIHPSQFLLLAVGCIAVLGWIGYLFRLDSLYGVSGYNPMALNSAICFVLLVAAALCARPERQPVATLLDDTSGGAIARRLLPAAFLLPILLGYARVVGERRGWFGAEFGTSLLVLTLIVVLNGLVWWHAQIQRGIDLQRRRAADALAASEQRYRAVVAQASEGITLVDAETLTIVETNNALAKLLGYTPHELVGRSISDFIVDTAEGVASRAQQTLTTGAGGATVTRRQYRRRDGSVVDVEKSATVLDLAGRRVLCTVIHDVTERLRADAALAEKHRQLEDAMRAEQEAHAELKRTQTALIQNEKLAGLGQMVAGVAHEINNPLAFVSNNVAVLQRDVRALAELVKLYAEADALIAQHNAALLARVRDLSERMDLSYTLSNLDEMLVRSRDGLKRIQQIVKDLRDFARLDAGDKQEADLNAGIESTVNIVRGAAKKKQVSIDLQLSPLPPIVCYPAKINQVVMNLITNAIDACADGGHVAVRTARDNNGDAVRIEVADDGKGIPREIQSRIFDPFFTTKPIGQGTGLGLSISYGIVRDHGGDIGVQSEPGRGTTFVVRLPFREPSTRDPAASARAATAHR